MDRAYENTYIGTFIYTLGFVLGTQHTVGNPVPPISLNLFQQTPADKWIGDVFASLGGKNFLIEFKRTEGKLDEKEIKKSHRLAEEIFKSDFSHLKEISFMSHFLACGYLNDQGNAGLFVKPYLGVADLNCQPFDEGTFIRGMLSGVAKIVIGDKTKNMPIGYSGEQFQDYLRLLKRLFDVGSSSSSGGIIMNVSEDGKITYLASDNIFDLTKTLEHYYEKQFQIRPARSHGLSR
ncbi:hypothetical protein [Herbaspirillum sp. RV1423]|uniref:hypothetical protein n=1 Tax=Herbaspirillum sp. RV1423 TaxID=1443993 RepID=UPI00068629EE|nr:hypothetical protein [Herbaspirillum sp. RV1423]